MDTKVPNWLNEELISNILNGVKINKTDISQAVPEGEHYFSTLFRVKINYENNEIENKNAMTTSLIIKTFPNGVMGDFIKESKAMEKEILMYKSILPEISKLCNKEISPKFYDCNRGDILVMQDLIFNNFKMEDRVNLIDYKCSELSIRILAEFHASSIIIHNRNNELIEYVGKEYLYTKNNNFMRSFIENCFKILSNEIKNWNIYSKYEKKLRDIGEKIWDIIIEELKPNNNRLCVLNHGDFWTNNLLFNSISNENIAARLIDFQFCRWTNPGFDLQRFFNTSLRNRNNIPKLIDLYYNIFNDFLEKYNILITKEQIENDIKRMNCYGLISVVCLLPTAVCSPNKPMNYKNVTRENYSDSFEVNNPYVIACKDDNYRKLLPAWLEYYEKEGLL